MFGRHSIACKKEIALTGRIRPAVGGIHLWGNRWLRKHHYVEVEVLVEYQLYTAFGIAVGGPIPATEWRAEKTSDMEWGAGA